LIFPAFNQFGIYAAARSFQPRAAFARSLQPFVHVSGWSFITGKIDLC
jgi:hypothetical protein